MNIQAYEDDIMDAYWVLKLVVIIFVLRGLRIFGAQSTAIYLSGVIGAYLFLPDKYLYAPENMLAASVLMFASYMIAVSIADFFKSMRHIDLSTIFRKDAIAKQIDFFIGLFVISWALSFFSMPFIESFAIMMLVFLIMDIASKNGSNFSVISIFKNLLVFAVLHMLFFNRLNLAGYILRQSFFGYGIYFAFSFVRYFNVYPCTIAELKTGMIPGETVVLDSGHYKKVRSDYFSVPYYLRKKASERVLGKKEIIMPFRALTEKDIEILKKKTEFEMLRVQRQIDMRVFVLIGVIAVLIF